MSETIEIVESEKKDVQKIEIDEDTLIEIERMIEQENVEARTIYLNDAIDIETVDKIVPLIHLFNREDESMDVNDRIPIKIYVNTVGGELYSGNAILAAIEGSKTPVWTYLEGGIGYSYGLVLFQSGHVRHMSRHAFLMYHELRAASGEQTLAEMKNTIQQYDRLQNMMDNYIVSRTAIPMKKLKKQRSKNLDWYIDFETAKRYQMFDVEI